MYLDINLGFTNIIFTPLYLGLYYPYLLFYIINIRLLDPSYLIQ